MTDNNPLQILTDDFEIIDKLKKLPRIPFNPFNGATIIEQIDKYVGQDFGLVFPFERVFYVIYKYGLHSDSGLILIICDFEHSKFLKKYFEKMDKSVFPNKNISDQMINEFLFYCNNFSLTT